MRTMVIKIGGRAFENRDGFYTLGRALKSLTDVKPVIVHGGGAEISAALKKANRHPTFIDGLRVTTAEDIEIVEQVLSETINRRIAAFLSEAGLQCQRLSGKSNRLFLIEPLRRNGHDYGFVGRITAVHPQAIVRALSHNLVPVISPISADENGQSYNVNADSAAAALAIGIRCDELVYFTDVPGVQVNGEIRTSMSIDEAQEFIRQGVIQGGMIAKMESIFEALAGGVRRAHITQWSGEETIENILAETPKTGTIIHP